LIPAVTYERESSRNAPIGWTENSTRYNFRIAIGMDAEASEVTQLLNAWCQGDAQALDQLAPMVEAELRRVAQAYLSREQPGHTLQPTALVIEAYLRLIEWKTVAWRSRAHFYAVAAKMMRRVLVTHAVTRDTLKRGGDAVLVSLTEAESLPDEQNAEILALDAALDRLARFDPRKSQLVELRFFGGLTAEEAAEVMGSSLRSVNREWSLARAWLFRELQGGTGPGST
jgi:RNA polymerase sigma-70 factor (ECF subfamily)